MGDGIPIITRGKVLSWEYYFLQIILLIIPIERYKVCLSTKFTTYIQHTSFRFQNRLPWCVSGFVWITSCLSTIGRAKETRVGRLLYKVTHQWAATENIHSGQNVQWGTVWCLRIPYMLINSRCFSGQRQPGGATNSLDASRKHPISDVHRGVRCLELRRRSLGDL